MLINRTSRDIQAVNKLSKQGDIMKPNTLREEIWKEITLFNISLKEKKREGKKDEGIYKKKNKTLRKNIKL